MNAGMSARRIALSAFGTVSTRLGGSTGSMSRDLSPVTMRSAARTAEEAGLTAAERAAGRTVELECAAARTLGAPLS
ncbi:hypothetical protein MTIM_19000 [Mycobacterium timonense]|uniref:Uncharacterized protein n=1 Tax=Mycobacterium timonense TaxID=701043 RepID=A0A7I9Z4Y6_9MYCO|nr:hypothetical protein MTIM_19000 [Mycobacterium timonense]